MIAKREERNILRLLNRIARDYRTLREESAALRKENAALNRTLAEVKAKLDRLLSRPYVSEESNGESGDAQPTHAALDAEEPESPEE